MNIREQVMGLLNDDTFVDELGGFMANKLKCKGMKLAGTRIKCCNTKTEYVLAYDGKEQRLLWVNTEQGSTWGGSFPVYEEPFLHLSGMTYTIETKGLY